MAIRPLRVTIDHDQSWQEMAAAMQISTWYLDLNESHFPIVGQGIVTVDIELFVPSVRMRVPDALQEIKRLKPGYRPSVLSEMFAVGAEHPNEQLLYTMPALGAVGMAEVQEDTGECLAFCYLGHEVIHHRKFREVGLQYATWIYPRSRYLIAPIGQNPSGDAQWERVKTVYQRTAAQ